MNEQELEQRVKNAIILLSDGHPYKVGDLTFSSRDKKHFSVTGWSVLCDLKDATKKNATIELDEIKNLFMKMVSSSKDLFDFIKNKEVKYCLAFDYGMGNIEICNEKDGKINWEIDLKE